MQRIELSGRAGAGLSAVVDDEDLNWLSKHSWCNKDGYAATSVNGHILKMHQILMVAAKDMVVDHINGLRLDNRKSNLRLCTPTQNRFNMPGRGGSSSYKGVSWNKRLGKWHAKASYAHLGFYDSELDAARAYNVGALKRYGEFARLNEIPSYAEHVNTEQV